MFLLKDKKNTKGPCRNGGGLKERVQVIFQYHRIVLRLKPHCFILKLILYWSFFVPDKRFLIFFFRQVRRNDTGRFVKEFPFISPCGKELNFIRGDDYPTVYTNLSTKSSHKTLEPEEHLRYGTQAMS